MRLKNPPVALTGKIERLVPGENVTLVNGEFYPMFIGAEDTAPRARCQAVDCAPGRMEAGRWEIKALRG